MASSLIIVESRGVIMSKAKSMRSGKYRACAKCGVVRNLELAIKCPICLESATVLPKDRPSMAGKEKLKKDWKEMSIEERVERLAWFIEMEGYGGEI